MTPRPVRRVLPPRPLLVDWLAAGVCAGGLLGTADSFALWLRGTVAPPWLLVSLILGGGIAVALPCLLLGLLATRLRRHTIHSEMVGVVTGPMLLASGLGPVVSAWRGSELAGAAVLGLTSLAAVLVGSLVAWFGGRLKRAGHPVSGPWIWAALATLIVGAEHATGIAGTQALLGLAAAAALTAGLAAGAVLAGRRAGAQRAASWSRSFGALAVAAALASFGPRVLPWLLVDDSLPSLYEGPSSLLLVVWPGAKAPGQEDGEDLSSLALLASEGVRFQSLGVRQDREHPWLVLADGAPLLGELSDRGYATAAIVTSADAGESLGVRDLNWQPGLRGLLEGPARHTVAGGLVWASGVQALGRLRLDAAFRPAPDVTEAARRWILGWRTSRSHVPFALLVDYRTGEPLEGGRDALDEELGRLLEHVYQIGLASRTVVIVAQEPEDGLASTSLVVRLSETVSVTTEDSRGIRAHRPVAPTEIAALLLEVASQTEQTALRLPGL